jgi:hypothetical protein
VAFLEVPEVHRLAAWAALEEGQEVLEALHREASVAWEEDRAVLGERRRGASVAWGEVQAVLEGLHREAWAAWVVGLGASVVSRQSWQFLRCARVRHGGGCMKST